MNDIEVINKLKYLIEIENIEEIDLIQEIINSDFEDIIKRNGLLECKAI